ncbi:MAG: hypothetical protein Q8P41_05760 [Pseudomonadota bacterium]|nr:hypothetical protein [Pseudomonadota bacterium]
MLPLPTLHAPTVLRLALLLLCGLLPACGDVKIVFPDADTGDDTGLPDTDTDTDTDTATDTDTDTAPPPDPFEDPASTMDADIVLEASGRTDGIGYGGGLASGGDLLGSSANDLIVGARYVDGGAGVYSGAVYVVADPPLGRSTLAEVAGMTIRGSVEYGQFGSVVTGAGDVDGDGYADIAASSPSIGAGTVYIFNGPFEEGDRLDSDADNTLVGDTEYGYAGAALAPGGDVNADGQDDLIVGVPNSSEGCQGCGAVMVSLAAGVRGTALLSTDAVRIYGDRTYGQIGYAVSSQLDVNGDGFPEIAVGSPYTAGGGVGLLYGPFRSGSFDLSDADAWFAGDTVGTSAGTALGGADVDGDGYDDLLVGAPQDGEAGLSAGKVYVEFGSSTRWSGENVLGSGATLLGSAGDYAGMALGPADDVDGDGTDDLLLGAPYSSVGAPYAGMSYLVYGPIGAGAHPLSEVESVFTGVQQSGYAGYSVASPGDIDGGGTPDIAIGAMSGLEQSIGAIFVFLGE